MKFKRDAARWRTEVNEVESAVSELVKENMVRAFIRWLRTFAHASHAFPTKFSAEPEVRSSFMFKKMQELEDRHEEGQDIQRRREDETALAFSGLSIYVGEFSVVIIRKAFYEWLY